MKNFKIFDKTFSDKKQSKKCGEPIQIVQLNNNREFELDMEALQNILLNESTFGKPLVILSIFGDFRKGKSFLLNFFLRYLYTKSHNKNMDWVTNEHFPFEGFSFRGGSDLETKGIVMWSEPFIINENNKEYVVFLMDTQGSFDTEHNIAETGKIFALSTLLSSIQIFNISHNIQENNFDNLGAFIEYGRLVLEESEEKPFQKLLFLIRDWQWKDEHTFGFEGGKELLDKVLVIKDRQPSELQRVRKLIKSCFDEIDCFLMPHPGELLATSRQFKGPYSDINSNFIECLKTLVPKVLDIGHSFKKINGKEIKSYELLEYFKTYIKLFAGGTLPEPKSMLEATAIAQNRNELEKAKMKYFESMVVLLKEKLDLKTLTEKHVELSKKVKDEFISVKRFGGNELNEPYLNELNEYLKKYFETFKKLNKQQENSKSEIIWKVVSGAAGLGVSAVLGGYKGIFTFSIGAIGYIAPKLKWW